MQTPIDLTGQKFGRWHVVEMSAQRIRNKPSFDCLCACGTTRVVQGTELRKGKSRSCGCAKFGRLVPDPGSPIGAGPTPTKKTWRAMMRRCYYPKNGNYPRYGGKGVTVCERWHVFANFLADMGARPLGTTIDRLDNTKGYEPGNCRWATAEQQTENRRIKSLTREARAAIFNDTRTAGLVAKEFGVSKNTIWRIRSAKLFGATLTSVKE